MKAYELNLTYYRKLAGLSINQLAFALNVSRGTIDNYEKGRTHPSMDMVVRLAHILGVTTDDLLGFSVHHD
ncbi:MAG: helix-turn-helix transcriptional regulator [Eubacteriales bacterium]|nr:helix-turn-helix transcriptional regulator [Eubacteriales bacterium]